jgi:hypothetical protein
MTTPSRAIMLFGTEEPVADPILLQAGALSAELEEGNLRFVRLGGREMLRAVSFIVRDKNWATYRPAISNLRVDQGPGRFSVAYDAVTSDAVQSLRYNVQIEGTADGGLSFKADGEAVSDFLTDRVGFVVLHPIDGVCGQPCTIEYADGRVEAGRFPELINPVQPMLNLRALTHTFAPGHRVTCRMEGDVFEMEDQRNWTDASYKTYSRPLALPWPYTLPKGERISQRVLLSVAMDPGAILPAASERTVLTLEPAAGTMPPLGFGLDPEDTQETLQAADRLRLAGPHHVLIGYDPERCRDTAALAALIEAGRALGGELWLEAVVRSLDRFQEEIQALGRTVRELGAPFSTLLISPAPDLKCTLPGSPWPPCPPLDAIYRAAREAFPGVRLGGGSFAFFTELNRKRPPVALLDLVSFTTIALMHAGDDRSATGGLEALPYIADTVRSFIQGKPYHVGPSAIAMRANPYGEAPMPNPHNLRQAMNRMDPRQRGLFAAAWTLGFCARFAAGGASAITLGAGTGDLGLLHTRGGYEKPWFDPQGGLYPVFHVFKGLGALAGLPLLPVRSSRPREILALGALVGGLPELWVANLTAAPQQVELPEALRTVASLDEHSFEAAAADPRLLETRERPLDGRRLQLAPYAVLRLRA